MKVIIGHPCGSRVRIDAKDAFKRPICPTCGLRIKGSDWSRAAAVWLRQVLSPLWAWTRRSAARPPVGEAAPAPPSPEPAPPCDTAFDVQVAVLRLKQLRPSWPAIPAALNPDGHAEAARALDQIEEKCRARAKEALEAIETASRQVLWENPAGSRMDVLLAAVRVLGAPPVKKAPKAKAPPVLSTAGVRPDLPETLEWLARKAWTSRAERFLFVPPAIRLDSREAMQSAVKLLYSHARAVAPGLDIPFMIPPVLITNGLNSAGQFAVDGEGWTSIKVASKFLKSQESVWLILAHEGCHHILAQTGIAIRDNVTRNERMTDATMFVCGFGQIVKSGFRTIERTPGGYSTTHLGYLSATEYEYAYQWTLRRAAPAG
jgi:hypothetical protein